jgi:hypothetical protein
MAFRLPDWPSLGLVLLAAIALWMSQEPRRTAAAWYNDVAAYNRSITRFLVDHRDELGGRPIAVFGVGGLSPWSHTNGSYLSRLLRKDATWLVFVPWEDAFYHYGALPGGTVSIRAESEACSSLLGRPATFLTFDDRGQGSIVASCEAALEHLRIPAAVEAWGPTSVTKGEANAGFNMYFTGSRLIPGVGVKVDGKRLPMAYGEAGKLMTTSIPAQSAHGGTIRFVVVTREQTVLEATVEVK